MRRTLLVMTALVALLASADALLARREARARREALRVGTVFTAAEAGELRAQPAFRLSIGGDEHAYGRVEGAWRCLSLHGAPADERAIQSWLDGVAQAEGIQVSSSVDEARHFGINAPETVRVAIQGPRAQSERGGDVRAQLELGKSLPGGEGCFVRRTGTKTIWSIATDLRAPLARRVAPGLPPFLAEGAVPAAWLAEGGGSARVTLERDERLVLVRRERMLDGEPPSGAMPPGAMPWSWELVEPAGPTALPDRPANAFVGFLERLPYSAVLDPASADGLGLAPPRASIELESREGTRLRLELGAPDRDGRVALRVVESGTLYRVEPAVYELALPSMERLTSAGEGEDPWSAFLRKGR